MKKFILAALAASVAASPVLASPYQGWASHDRDGQSYYQSRDDHGDRWDHGSRFGDRGFAFGQRNWRRGERFDNRYADNYRVIANPSFYRLHDAPRGYRWMQSGNDAVLVGLTSGIIAAVVANMIR